VVNLGTHGFGRCRIRVTGKAIPGGPVAVQTFAGIGEALK
jgi:hypothetical protein